MISMKRFGLAALFAIGVALFTSSPALAEDWGTITLTNRADATDRDYAASGQATLTDVSYYTTIYPGEFKFDVYTAYLTVSCEGLTPGATYRVGPTGILDTWVKQQGKFVLVDSYAYVTASSTGTAELAVQVKFVGDSWWWFEPCIGEGWQCYGYWQYLGPSGYSLSVARKQGSKYIAVLSGYFPPEP